MVLNAFLWCISAMSPKNSLSFNMSPTSEDVFVMQLYLHFICDLDFVVVLYLSMFFIHICFSTSSLTLLWTIVGFLHPFYTFIPVHRSSIIIEVITTVLNFLFFFYDKILKVQKSIKSTKKH